MVYLTQPQAAKLRKLGYLMPCLCIECRPSVTDALKWLEKTQKLFINIHQGIDSRPRRKCTYYFWALDCCITGNTLYAPDSVKKHFKTSSLAEVDALGYLLRGSNFREIKRTQKFVSR